MNLDGKTALVTGAGATGGIGFQIARLLRARDAEVLISGRDPERGAAAARALGDGTRFIRADLTDLAEVQSLAEAAGDVDILVNNAGLGPMHPTIAQDVESYTQAFDVNVRAPYFLTAALAPAMLAKGDGSIINISTLAAREGVPGMSVYGASKAALEALTRSWAAEFSDQGVRVNAVIPGPTRTEFVMSQMGEFAPQMADLTMLKRMADATEIAEVVVFLAEPRSSFITGAVIAADGGATAATAARPPADRR
jgi:NAD(P)-dependent dehydrogenase (short-subunit alcohol dehydrogenase family)